MYANKTMSTTCCLTTNSGQEDQLNKTRWIGCHYSETHLLYRVLSWVNTFRIINSKVKPELLLLKI